MSTGNYTSTNDAFDLALKQARDTVDTLVGANPGFQFVASAAYNPETNSISQAQVESYRATKADELRAMMTRLQLTPELRAELEASIQSLGGAGSKQAIDAMASAISNQIADASAYSTSQTSLNDQEVREDAKRAELLRDLAAYREDSQKWRHDFAENGYKDTPENEKELADLWAKMETLEPGSQEWIETHKQINTKNAAYFQHVKEEAIKKGDWETVKKADEAIKSNQQAQENVKEISLEGAEIDAQVDQDKHIDGRENDVDAASFYGDDEPTLTQTKTQFTAEGLVELGNLTPTTVPNNAPSGGRGIG